MDFIRFFHQYHPLTYILIDHCLMHGLLFLWKIQEMVVAGKPQQLPSVSLDAIQSRFRPECWIEKTLIMATDDLCVQMQKEQMV